MQLCVGGLAGIIVVILATTIQSMRTRGANKISDHNKKATDDEDTIYTRDNLNEQFGNPNNDWEVVGENTVNCLGKYWFDKDNDLKPEANEVFLRYNKKNFAEIEENCASLKEGAKTVQCNEEGECPRPHYFFKILKKDEPAFKAFQDWELVDGEKSEACKTAKDSGKGTFRLMRNKNGNRVMLYKGQDGEGDDFFEVKTPENKLKQGDFVVQGKMPDGTLLPWAKFSTQEWVEDYNCGDCNQPCPQ